MKIKSIVLITLTAAALASCSMNLSETPLTVMPASVDRELDAAMKFIEKAPESAVGYDNLAAALYQAGPRNGRFQP